MIELRPFEELSADSVAAIAATSTERIAAQNPSLDLRRGVFNELLIFLHSVLDSQNQQLAADYLNARSLKQITEDPTLADPDAVDDVLSNFRVTRFEGRRAKGQIVVVVSDDVTVTVAQSSVWEIRGNRYLADLAYTAKKESVQVTGGGDRLLQSTGDGNYAFTIDVTAEDEGTGFDIRSGSSAFPLVSPPNYVTGYAAGDFVPGYSAETNAELLARLQEGIAAKALSNRVNMNATLRANTQFERTVATSIVGYGDPELRRAIRGVLGIAAPGRCDWYVRGQELLYRVTKVYEATLLDAAGTWSFAVPKGDLPGFYEVTDIRPELASDTVGGYAILSDSRGRDLDGETDPPDVANAVESAYSAFSTAVLRFEDTDTAGLAAGAKRNYSATLLGMPLVREMQDYFGGPGVRPYGGDCLIKAPVPCFVAVSFSIYRKSGQADPDLAAIKDAIVHAINTLGFVGALYASTIHEVVHSYLAAGQTVSAIDMLGRIRSPAGDTTYIRSDEVLTVPDLPGEMVTANTVQLFAGSEGIGISVVSKIPTTI